MGGASQVASGVARSACTNVDCDFTPTTYTPWSDDSACGSLVRTLNPGTYYNVKARLASGTGTAAGALLMVVVGRDNKIKEVQVTAGGTGTYAEDDVYFFADTRLNSAMDISNANYRCQFTLEDMSEPKKTSMVFKSIASGTNSGMTCLTEDTYYACAKVAGATNGGCATANADFDTWANADLGDCTDDGTGECVGAGASAGATETGVLRSACDTSDHCTFRVTDACEFKGTCGTRTFADTVNAMTFHNALNTDAAVGAGGEVSGVRHTVQCDAKHQVTSITVTQGGNTDTDLDNVDDRPYVNRQGECVDAGSSACSATDLLATTKDACGSGCTFNEDTAPAPKKLMVGGGRTGYAVTKDCTNDFYYQFGFYSTGTPRWNRDLAQNNHDMGRTPKDEQVALYGMKNHMQYQFKLGSATMEKDSFYGKAREIFSDLNSGIGSFDVGYSITDTDDYDDTPQMTASVIAGENGAESDFASGFGEMIEFAEKYAYIGKGYDKLTVTPIPDAMTDQKVTITYTGPSAGCSVTEVDRGTHESSECPGRGNCDYATGTCLCDAGYTLEACSEQTVLV